MAQGKCPECGARLRVAAGQSTITCEYCGSQWPVARQPRPPRGPVPGAPGPRAVHVGGGASKAWIALVVIPIALVLAGGTAVFLAAGRSGGGGMGLLEKMAWTSWQQQAIAARITDDAIADPVGWVRLLRGSKQTLHLAAFDGASGERLWLTDHLVHVNKQHATLVVQAADKLLLADELGRLRAFELATGKPAWSAPLGERARQICGAGAGTVRVRLRDERERALSLADGKQVELADVEPWHHCAGVWSGEPGGPTPAALLLPDVEPRVEGMYSDKSLYDRAGGRLFALGVRRKGTRTPLVARVDLAAALGREVVADGPPPSFSGKVEPVWMTRVVQGNPLAHREAAPELAAFAAGKLVVPYEPTASGADTRLACFDGETGRRLWDVAIPGSRGEDVEGLSATKQRVFVSVYCCSLYVHELQTGKHLLTIGKR